MTRQSVCCLVVVTVLAAVAPRGAAACQLPATPIRITVDDFRTPPNRGNTSYPYTRLQTDKGALGATAITYDYAAGRATLEVPAGGENGGMWMALGGLDVERRPINFSRLLAAPVLPAYQACIGRLRLEIVQATPGARITTELKNGAAVLWAPTWILSGTAETIAVDLPVLGDVTNFNIVVPPGSSLTLNGASFDAASAAADTAERVFAWTYSMLYRSWSPQSGLVADKSRDPAGTFDAVQVTGSFAAATAVAAQVGLITREAAIDIVQRTHAGLAGLPRYHGLFPHWVVYNTATSSWLPHPASEWSSVDTVIALFGLLGAERALGLDPSTAVAWLTQVDWADLRFTDGIGHGYAPDGSRLASAWDVFGSESGLVAVAYAAATGEPPPLRYPDPPTADGSGFLDGMLELFLPSPARDHWGNDWIAWGDVSRKRQIEYYPTTAPLSCAAQRGLFGLSAGEVSRPADVALSAIYQPFGVGGRFADPNDETALTGRRVVVPHYAAMISAYEPDAAMAVWRQLIEAGRFTPLTNVESAAFRDESNCLDADLVINDTKGNWNLALAALGIGRRLTERHGARPPLWSITTLAPIDRGYGTIFRAAVWRPSQDLAVAFANFGLFIQQDAAWRPIHPLPATQMVTGDLDGNGQDDLVVDFPGYGVWAWMNHGSTWRQVHSLSPRSMVMGDLDRNGKDDVVFVFAGHGVWRWSDDAWHRLHGTDATRLAIGQFDEVPGADLVLDFPGYGLFQYASNTWAFLHPFHAREVVAADIDGDGIDEKIVDFDGGHGIWAARANGAWNQIHGTNARHIAAGYIDGNCLADLVIDFGPSGIWTLRDGQRWLPLHPFPADRIVVLNRNAPGRDDVVIDFGAPWGIWQWTDDQYWTPIHPLPSISLVGGRFH